jgi:hypothetical protein
MARFFAKLDPEHGDSHSNRRYDWQWKYVLAYGVLVSRARQDIPRLQQMAAWITERSRIRTDHDLKRICKEEGAVQTGNKATLQARVAGRTSSPLYPYC